MKLFYMICLMSMFNISNALAYLNDNPADGEAKASSGDQLGNLHSLNALSSTNVRRLKKIDEAYAKNNGQSLDASILENVELALNKKSEESKNILALRKSLKIIQNGVKNSNTLIIKIDGDKYLQLENISAQNMSDADLAKELAMKIRRR